MFRPVAGGIRVAQEWRWTAELPFKLADLLLLETAVDVERGVFKSGVTQRQVFGQCVLVDVGIQRGWKHAEEKRHIRITLVQVYPSKTFLPHPLILNGSRQGPSLPRPPHGTEAENMVVLVEHQPVAVPKSSINPGNPHP